MSKVNSAQLPRDLLAIYALPEMSFCYCVLDEGEKQASPFTFERHHMLADRAIEIVEFEQRRSHRASASESRAARPTEPAVHEFRQTRQPRRQRLDGHNDMRTRHGGCRVEQLDLQLLL